MEKHNIKQSDRISLGSPVNLNLFLCLYGRFSKWEVIDLQNSFWRIYWAQSSGAVIIYEGREIELSPGKIVLIPPETKFSSKSYSAFDKLYAHFTLDFLEKRLEKGIYPIEVDDFPEIEHLLESIQMESLLRPHLEVQLIIMQVILKSLRKINEAYWKHHEEDNRILKVISIMKNNLDKKISNKEIAAKINMHHASFVRFFKNKQSLSPQQYYIRLRLEKAANLLLHSNETLDQIASMCGFWDRSYFSRCFKKYWKCNPGFFRKWHEPKIKSH